MCNLCGEPAGFEGLTTLGVRYFFFRREEGRRGRALDVFGVRLVSFFLSTSDGFSLSGGISSNGVSIRMSRPTVEAIAAAKLETMNGGDWRS